MKNKLFRQLSAIILTALLVTAVVPSQANANSLTIRKVAAPSGLNAMISVSTGITLSWTDNSTNETGFVIEQQLISADLTYEYDDIAVLHANTTTFNDAGSTQLQGFKAVSYRIKAAGSGLILDSDYSNAIRVDVKTPEQPVVEMSFYYDGSVNVSWSGCTPALVDHFVIQRKAPGGSSFTEIATVTSDKSHYYDTFEATQKQPGGTYQYKVSALGYFGDSISLPTSITLPSASPAAPSNLVVTPTAEYKVKITWDDNSDNEAGFIVEYSKNGVAQTPKVFDPYISTVAFNDLSGGTYSFKVKAINTVGSSYSNTVTMPIPFTAPISPSNLAAVALPNGSVSLTWSDNSNNELYFYLERKTGTGSFIKIAEVNENVTSFVDQGLTPNTVYTYRLEALNSVGDSDYSGTASVTTNDATGDDIDYSTASSWAKPEIVAAEEYGLLTAKLQDDFQQNITREEFCEIAVRLYEKLSASTAGLPAANPFTDTTNSELLKAYKLGITNGTSPDQFSPTNPITRQEISVMLVRTLKAAFPDLVTLVTNPHVFADESLTAAWALPQIKFAYSVGIMNGVGGNLFNPLNQTSREQGIAIIKRSFVAYD